MDRNTITYLDEDSQTEILGAVELPELSLGELVDRAMRNNVNPLTIAVFFNQEQEAGPNIRRVIWSADAPTNVAYFGAEFMAGGGAEAFTIPVEGGEGSSRTITFDVDGRTREITLTGGTAGISDVLDPTLPRVSVATLLAKLESYNVARVCVITQASPAGGHVRVWDDQDDFEAWCAGQQNPLTLPEVWDGRREASFVATISGQEPEGVDLAFE